MINNLVKKFYLNIIMQKKQGEKVWLNMSLIEMSLSGQKNFMLY